MIRNKSNKIILDYIENNLEQIKVKSGKCRYNFRCHMNSVHEAINNKEKKIALCFYICDNQPIIHFINVTKKGKFVDNTLGVWSNKYKYYFVRYIKKEDFYTIEDVFSNYREELRSKLPWYINLIKNVDF
ncbi:MAG: hypothetical protein ACOC3V_02565 [bacterium]